ncbi:hypothetical protein GWE_01785 [Chlamydia psittaci NJ1]|nr:hypothetical protein B712_0687 [Chlamydia psittaci NJ1]KPZ36040.1 hypothetical protein GWE_01785 [Chlamydia psittaci NJ1]
MEFLDFSIYDYSCVCIVNAFVIKDLRYEMKRSNGLIKK